MKPKLIVGQRSAGKTTAIVEWARTNNAVIFVPNNQQANFIRRKFNFHDVIVWEDHASSLKIRGMNKPFAVDNLFQIHNPMSIFRYIPWDKPIIASTDDIFDIVDLKNFNPLED